MKKTLCFLFLAAFLSSLSVLAQSSLTNGMAHIPAGSFVIGDSLDSESDASLGSVYVSGFYMDTNLVSYGVWEQVYQWATTNGTDVYSFDDPGTNTHGLNYPVNIVNWYDAVKWCNARSEMAGQTPVYYTDAGLSQVYRAGAVDPYANWNVSGYRLPTEAEWEKAARGGLSQQRFPLGNSISESMANYFGDPYNPSGNTGYSYDQAASEGYNPTFDIGSFSLGYTSPVGYFPTNGYGLTDMAGNVFEWCWDWYASSYGSFPLTDPHGPDTGTDRAARGGAWDVVAFQCRTANRGGNLVPFIPLNDYGFRAVLPDVQFVTITLDANPTNEGSVTGGGTFFSAGISVTNMATANPGYELVNWTTNGVQVSTSNPYIFPGATSEILVANFGPTNYTITVQSSPPGASSVSLESGAFSYLTPATFTAFANAGYTFSNWTVNGAEVTNTSSYSLTVTSNETLVANFNQLNYTVSLSSADPSEGSVSGDGVFGANDMVTNSAMANNGFQFVDWTANSIVVSTASNYVYTITTNVTLVANFAPIYYTLTVVPSPGVGGSVNAGGTFSAGTSITNMATTNGGYTFVNWTINGVQVGTDPTGYVTTLGGNVVLVANFMASASDYSLTVLPFPPAGGNVTANNGEFPVNSLVTNLATPNAGYQFTNWTLNGAVVTTSNTYVAMLTNNETLVASFISASNTLTVVANPFNGGTFSTSSGVFATGTTITNTATASAGYQFTNWTVNGTVVSTSTNYIFMLTNDLTLVANFVSASNTLTVIASPVNGGTALGSGTYNTGTVITNMAIASNGFAFVNWTTNGVQASTLNNYVITLAKDETLVANFIPASNTLTVIPSPINGGTATGSGTYNAGTVVTNIATASNGFAFVNWTTNGVQATTLNNYIITLTRDETVVANFMSTNTGSGTNASGSTNLITVLSSPSTGSMANLGGTFLTGSMATVSVTPNAGYQFVSWNIGSNVVSTSNTYVFTVTTNVMLTAMFSNSLAAYTVTATGSPDDEGSVTGGGSFAAGSSYSLTPVASNGFAFIGWTGDATGTAVPLTNHVSSDLNIVANFAPIGINTLTVTATPGGSVTPQVTDEILPSGKTVVVTATPAAGYMFSGWTGTITSSENPLTVPGTSSVVLQANFISNLFPSTKGSFNGLFATTNGVTETTAGMLKGLTVSSKETYSGSVLFAGGTYPITGTFSSTGSSTKTVTLKGGGTLTFTMQLANVNGAGQLTGTVAGAVNGASWTAYLTAYYSTTSAASSQYTLLIPPDPTNTPPTSSPGGDGYLSIADTKGTIKLTGALADGTSVSQSTAVSVDGYIPVYASLYKNQGLLLGWLNLGPLNTNAGGLTWINPGSSFYSAGFTNVVPTNEIVPALWTTLPDAISDLTNLSLTGTAGESNAAPIAVSVNSTTGKVTGTSSSGPVTGLVSPKTGVLTVTVGSGASKVSVFGAVAVAGTNVTSGGYYLSKTNTPVQAHSADLAR